MGFLNWMKKATKVIGKMAEEAAEEPLEEKSSAKCSQVPNPNHDPYLEKWNNRKPSRIINLEMPELTFQTRYDFSKVRGFDFGMENNRISIFIDGKNQKIAKENILKLNAFLSQGYKKETDVPEFHIEADSIRFEPSERGGDDYTRLFMMPPTPTGKKPKYPLKMSFCLMSHDEQWKVSSGKGKEIFGHIYYLQDGNVGKAEVICWKHQGKKSSYFVFHIRRSSNELLLSKIEKHINCFSECTCT